MVLTAGCVVGGMGCTCVPHTGVAMLWADCVTLCHLSVSPVWCLYAAIVCQQHSGSYPLAVLPVAVQGASNNGAQQ